MAYLRYEITRLFLSSHIVTAILGGTNLQNPSTEFEHANTFRGCEMHILWQRNYIVIGHLSMTEVESRGRVTRIGPRFSESLYVTEPKAVCVLFRRRSRSAPMVSERKAEAVAPDDEIEKEVLRKRVRRQNSTTTSTDTLKYIKRIASA